MGPSKEFVLMNVYVALPAKGAIPIVCLSVRMGVGWGSVALRVGFLERPNSRVEQIHYFDLAGVFSSANLLHLFSPCVLKLFGVGGGSVREKPKVCQPHVPCRAIPVGAVQAQASSW